jgi:hypothetical protein
MKKLSTFAVLTAAIVSMFTVVGSAQAATWHVAPAGGFYTAASGGTVLKVQGKTTSCVSTSASGRMSGSGGAVVNGPNFVWDWAGVATITPAFQTCTNAGINYTVKCGVASLNVAALQYNSGVATTEAASAGGTTGGSVSDILCTIKPTATPSNNCTTVTGTVPATYANPSTLAAGTSAANQGSLSVWLTGQSLTAASVGGCIASIGTGSATFGSSYYTVYGNPAATAAAPHIWAQ